MMIDFLWQNIEKIGEVANRQVRSLFGGYVNSEVLSIDENVKKLILSISPKGQSVQRL